MTAQQNVLFIDSETYSELDLRKVGMYKYAENCEVLLVSYALNESAVAVWEPGNEEMPADLHRYLADNSVLLCAHNSRFDRVVLTEALGKPTRITRWRDTSVLALSNGFPSALGVLSELFKLDKGIAKLKDGKDLINLFCKPQKAKGKITHRNTKTTHPEQWEMFKQYASNDILAMRYMWNNLSHVNHVGFELDLWHLDNIINDRGVCVDLDLAEKAISMVEHAQSELKDNVSEQTHGAVSSATQREALLKYILAEHGVTLPDLRSDTVARRLADPDLPDAVKELLELRAQASTSSTAKYKAIIESASRGNRLRGNLWFYGAHTGRWTGAGVQLQNLPRQTLKQDVIDQSIVFIKNDFAEYVYDNPMLIAKNAIRGCIIAPENKKLVVADLSNIEGRVLPWLAGEEWKIQAFRDVDAGKGHDLYELSYSKAFDVPIDDVIANRLHGDGSYRQIGKVMELAFGYGGGVGSFLMFAKLYRIDLDALCKKVKDTLPFSIAMDAASFFDMSTKHVTDKPTFIVLDTIKRLWRVAHPKIVRFWRELEDLSKTVITQPSHAKTTSTGLIKLGYVNKFLLIKLPSGRILHYPFSRVTDNKIMFKTLHRTSRKWSDQDTYGARLAENVTQAISRDILTANMPEIEKEGYEIVLTVHDELITETPDSTDYTPETLARMMSVNPGWSAGLPLAAKGFESTRYKKG